MALLAFWQPALSLMSKCRIVMLITSQIKCLLACIVYKDSRLRVNTALPVSNRSYNDISDRGRVFIADSSSCSIKLFREKKTRSRVYFLPHSGNVHETMILTVLKG